MTSQTLHCSFYLYFIEKPIKCAIEDIPLQKIRVLCALTQSVLECVCMKGKRVFESVQVLTGGGGGN